MEDHPHDGLATQDNTPTGEQPARQQDHPPAASIAGSHDGLPCHPCFHLKSQCKVVDTPENRFESHMTGATNFRQTN